MSGQLTLFDRSAIASDLQFAEFYRERLRPVMGERLRAADLRAAYLAWAEAKGRGSLSFRDLSRLMQKRGHRKICSNGVRYLDIAFAAGAGADASASLVGEATAYVLDALSTQGERERRARSRLIELTSEIDTLIDQMQRLRRAVEGALDA